MTYGTRQGVKRILHIEDDTAWDNELDECLIAANDRIDNRLKQFVTVPLSTVPDMITKITENMAAGMFCENHVKERPTEMALFTSRADRWLEEYIKQNHGLWT